VRVAVIGAGVMGLATALELSARGHRVRIHERDVVGNELASSSDRSKVFRFAYPDPFYADLGRRALPLWRELEGRAGEPLLEQCGVLYLDADGSDARRVDEALATIGAPHELLDAGGIERRFPAFRLPRGTLGVWDPSGGFVRADRVVAALARLARAAGVEIRERDPVRREALPDADGVVLAAGPWSRGLFADLPLRTSVQETVYAQPLDVAALAPARFPVFIEARSGFYGFPVHADGAVKLALHRRGAAHPPLERQSEASPAFIEACREFWSAFVPALADARIVRSRLCVYNDTPDEDFLIGSHPSGVMLCTGFSGHGFKFAPLVGRLCAQLLCGEPTDVDVSRFAPARSLPFAR
jgi:sarcosine oxidase